jgi:hypothetical protein
VVALEARLADEHEHIARALDSTEAPTLLGELQRVKASEWARLARASAPSMLRRNGGPYIPGRESKREPGEEG